MSSTIGQIRFGQRIGYNGIDVSSKPQTFMSIRKWGERNDVEHQAAIASSCRNMQSGNTAEYVLHAAIRMNTADGCGIQCRMGSEAPSMDPLRCSMLALGNHGAGIQAECLRIGADVVIISSNSQHQTGPLPQRMTDHRNKQRRKWKARKKSEKKKPETEAMENPMRETHLEQKKSQGNFECTKEKPGPGWQSPLP